MAEVDETRVRESMDRETSVRVEIVGSDDVEITKSETTEREVEITSDSDKLEETDGMLILTKSEDHIKISSGRIKVSHNVKQLVARYETATAVAAPINSYPYDTSGPDWHDEQSDKELYIHANDVAKNGIIHQSISKDFPDIRGHSYILKKFKLIPTHDDESGNPVRDYYLQILVDAGPGMTYIFARARSSGPVELPHITYYTKDPRYPHAQ